MTRAIAMSGAGRMLRPAAALLLAGAILSGCGWVRVPVRSGPAAPPAAGTEARSPAADTVTVRPGDTIYSIARQYDVPVRGLIHLNNLQPPYTVEPGALLRLPPSSAVHTVAAGDTLYGISRRYGVDMARLARENELDPRKPIVPGQKLIIPEAVATVAAAPQTMPATSAPAQPDVGAPPSASVVESEPLPPLPGQSGGQAEVAAGEARPAPPRTERPAAAPAEQAAVAPARPPATVRSSRGFIKPVDGPILSAYGPKSGGRHNDGINIAAPRGTPVRAAKDGVVAYAGNELPGFGNLVLVKHDGGWITAYGHNEEILVTKGQAVKQGQPIARVGSSGNVSQPQVHFELRQGSRAVDPTPYLSGEASRASSAGGQRG